MEQDEYRTRRARELRRDMTPTEKRLWYHLRGRRFNGFKFRRQTPIFGYIADFYCADFRLIIELDGESHVGREERDRERQRNLESQGFVVLRICDTEVYDDLDTILEWIWAHCNAPVQDNPSPPAPLPQGERGEKGSALGSA